jgi:hypothetical protein
MPKFIMPLADADAARAFADLPPVQRGYVEAMFFTSTGYAEDDDLEEATFGDLHSDTLRTIARDCAAFVRDNCFVIGEAKAECPDYDDEQLGRDLWLSRNGHGAGFFDRELGTAGDVLQEEARRMGETTLYRGDDGRLYLD